MSLKFLEECIKNTYGDDFIVSQVDNAITIKPKAWISSVESIVISANADQKFNMHLKLYDLRECVLSSLEFDEVVKIVHDCIMNKPNQIIDFEVRMRLERFFPYCDVDTFDRFREATRRRYDLRNSGLHIMHYSEVRFSDRKNYGAKIEQIVLPLSDGTKQKIFRIGVSNKIYNEKYGAFAFEYDSYIDESDVDNTIHILEQLYADTQQYELSTDKYNSFGAKLWPMTPNGSVNADVHFGKMLSVYGVDKPRGTYAVNKTTIDKFL